MSETTPPPETTGSALARRAAGQTAKTAPVSVDSYIQSCQGEISRALPRGMNADRIARIALTAVRQNPKLGICTPGSFAGALLTVAALGLEPNTPSGEAYLVPYSSGKTNSTECQLIVGYQGLVKMFYQHPLALCIDAQPLRDGDEFDYCLGSDPYLIHKPLLGNQGSIIAYWAQARLTNGAAPFTIMTPQEIQSVRGKVTSSGINNAARWMERKTVIRQLMKLLPKTSQAGQVLGVDERLGSDLRKELPAAVEEWTQ